MKKLLAILFTVVMVLTVLPIQNVSAETLPVIDKSERLTLNYTYKELDTVNTKKFKLKFKEKFSVSKATFSSSNKKVAKVSKKGVVTAKKEGTAIITVHYKNNTYQCGVVVFDGKGTMYELRKNAKNVRDNCSLLALYFDVEDDFKNENYSDGYKDDTYDIPGVPDKDRRDVFFTSNYRCYEVRKNDMEYLSVNDTYPFTGFNSNYANIDWVQTRKNLLATGLFVEDKSKIEWSGLKEAVGYYNGQRLDDTGLYVGNHTATHLLPKKPFKYNGKTYDYIAEYNGYYISCLTGVIYTEFSEKGFDEYGRQHFRNKKGEIFGAVDYSRYEKNGELTYSFFPTVVKGYFPQRKNNKNETFYLWEPGNLNEMVYETINGVFNLTGYTMVVPTYGKRLELTRSSDGNHYVVDGQN